MIVYNILKKIYPFAYSVVGEGNDNSLKVFKKLLNFKIKKIKPTTELNGWIVPEPYNLKNAKIFNIKDKCLYDGKKTPLGVILGTSEFKGKIDLKTLKSKIYTHSENKSYIPFHCVNQYRPGKKDWGFCMSSMDKKKFKEKYYKILIEKQNIYSSMKILDYKIKGKSNKTIVIYAHNCHPYQANDNMSGCAAGIALIKYLEKRKNFFSYNLLISPEIYGPLFWLKEKKKINNIIGAIKLGALGSTGSLKLQKSFESDSFIDKYAEIIFKNKKLDIKNFRDIWGNDETVFEAPGYEIPSITVTRYPFKYYHSNKDNLKNINKNKIKNSYNFLKNLILNYENNFKKISDCKNKKIFKEITNKKKGLKFKFLGKGLYCLANKKYNLYKSVWDPTSGKKRNRNIGRKWNKLMTDLPRVSKNGVEIIKLSKIYKIEFYSLLNYLKKWQEVKLGKIYK